MVIVKRQWNSLGQIPVEAWIIKDGSTIKQNNLSPGQKVQLSKFLNSVDFSYIPAIKDRDSFASLIERMCAAISKNEILIDKTRGFIRAIEDEASSLTKNISTLMPGSVSLSPPVDMERLFRNLDFSIGSGGHSLLWQKGDGIKARYIPEILRFINESESRKKYFIWGFEEPENSLDLEAATTEALRFKEFSQRTDTQVFITSHSPAFYLSDIEADLDKPLRRFFVTNQTVGQSDVVTPEEAIRPIDSIEETESVMAGAGLLRLPFVIRQISRLNHEITEERERIKQLTEQITTMREQFAALDKPTLYVEGPHDQSIVMRKLEELNYAGRLNVFTLGGTPKTPHAVVKSLLEAGGLNAAAPTFFLFDNDKAGRHAAKEISKKSSFYTPCEFLDRTWVWVLPFREEYKDFLDRWRLDSSAVFSPIEFMFPPEEALKAYKEAVEEHQGEISHTIQGDIWSSVMSFQERSYRMQALHEDHIDCLYTRGVHDDLKAAFSKKSSSLPSDHLDNLLKDVVLKLL